MSINYLLIKATVLLVLHIILKQTNGHCNYETIWGTLPNMETFPSSLIITYENRVTQILLNSGLNCAFQPHSHSFSLLPLCEQNFLDRADIHYTQCKMKFSQFISSSCNNITLEMTQLWFCSFSLVPPNTENFSPC